MKRLSLISSLCLLSACGGSDNTQDGRVKQFTVKSAPGICYHFTGNPYLCPIVIDMANQEQSLLYWRIKDFDPKWGTEYKITILEKDIAEPLADGPSTTRDLVSIDSSTEDPVGTRYTNDIANVVPSDPYLPFDSNRMKYSFQFIYEYNETNPVYCSPEICADIDNGVYNENVFELMEVDGERRIYFAKDN